MDEFASLFNPGIRNEQQEKQRLELMRENPESGAPPLSTVDLDGKKAVIRLPAKPVQEPAPEPAAD